MDHNILVIVPLQERSSIWLFIHGLVSRYVCLFYIVHERSNVYVYLFCLVPYGDLSIGGKGNGASYDEMGQTIICKAVTQKGKGMT